MGNDALERVLEEIRKERVYQQEKWGNAFDDANTPTDWAAYIIHYLSLGMTTRLGNAKGRPWREILLKVATMCVAAIESYDRTT